MYLLFLLASGLYGIGAACTVLVFLMLLKGGRTPWAFAALPVVFFLVVAVIACRKAGDSLHYGSVMKSVDIPEHSQLRVSSDVLLLHSASESNSKTYVVNPVVPDSLMCDGNVITFEHEESPNGDIRVKASGNACLRR